MKLRDKNCHIDYFLYDNIQKKIMEPPSTKLLLSPDQARKMDARPVLLIQYAHFLADLFTINGTRPEVYAYVSFVSYTKANTN